MYRDLWRQLDARTARPRESCGQRIRVRRSRPPHSALSFRQAGKPACTPGQALLQLRSCSVGLIVLAGAAGAVFGGSQRCHRDGASTSGDFEPRPASTYAHGVCGHLGAQWLRSTLGGPAPQRRISASLCIDAALERSNRVEDSQDEPPTAVLVQPLAQLCLRRVALWRTCEGEPTARHAEHTRCASGRWRRAPSEGGTPPLPPPPLALGAPASLCDCIGPPSFVHPPAQGAPSGERDAWGRPCRTVRSGSPALGP